jgi:GWxTD domain-containing protein
LPGLKLQAQWLVEALNAIGPGYNTQVFISTEDLQESVNIHLGFKIENAKTYFFQDEFSADLGEPSEIKRNYQLQPGTYTLEVILEGNTAVQLSIPYTCESVEQAIFVSDIFLAESKFPSDPQIKKHSARIANGQNQLHFQCELLSKRYQQLTARAVLYRERRSGTHARVFTSIQQQNKVLDMIKAKTFFEGVFDLQNLDAGSYLIEVLVFEDDQLLGERSVRFTISWQGYAELLQNLDEAIEMLEPIASQEEINEMLGIQDNLAKRAAFEFWWVNYTSETGAYQLQNYYQKLDKAAALFSDKLPVWKSDRGKTYLLYGNPSRQEIVKNEMRYERWYYEAWDMVLWFREEGENFIRLN